MQVGLINVVIKRDLDVIATFGFQIRDVWHSSDLVCWFRLITFEKNTL